MKNVVLRWICGMKQKINNEIFNLWIKGCKVNKTILFCLDGKGETGLYKTTSSHLVKNNYYYDSPVYHVWINGERLIATTSYLAAYRKWESATKNGYYGKKQT